MARKPRLKSDSGIYHVMLRGINKQVIFFDEDDMVYMMKILQKVPFKRNYQGEIDSANLCHIYAYCILHNHVHILIKEDEQSVSEVIKRVEVSYAAYYNKKHERIGHLYQGRFESEPVNDDLYFHTLLRYIAQNPVKAMEAATAAEYPYSSWNEYVNSASNIIRVLKPTIIQEVLDMYPLEELKVWVNEDNDDKCMDMDDFINVKSDKEAWDILSDSCHLTDPEDFRLLDPQTQIYYLLDAIEHGIKITQAARLGTITRYQITKAYKKKFGIVSSDDHPKRGINSARGSDPLAEENEGQNVHFDSGEEDLYTIQQKIRGIVGLGKKTYQNLHLIVEYLYVNSPVRCVDVADFLNINHEKARRLLVHLINENIVDSCGENKNRIYSLKTRDKFSKGV